MPGPDDFSWLEDLYGPGDDYGSEYGGPGGDGLTDPGGNERDTYEQDYQGGDSDGSNGSPTNPNSPNFDPSILSKLFGGALGGKDGGMLAKLLKSAGLTNGAGDMDLLSLLALLGGLGGTLNQNKASKSAVAELKAAADKSNQFAQDTIGGAQKNYQPYMDAGTAALPQLQAMVGNSNLADKFGGPVANHGGGGSGLYGAIPLRELAMMKGK